MAGKGSASGEIFVILLRPNGLDGLRNASKHLYPSDVVDDLKNAGIERPSSIWGDNPRLRNVILIVVAALIVIRAITTIWLIEDYWRTAAEWIGFSVAPAPDPGRAYAKLRPPDIQAAFGDPGNYPDDARDHGEQGSVVSRLSIAPSGVVAGCEITSSSKSASLDAATCRLARARIRFDPARNKSGEAVASTYVLRVRWRLPRE